MPSMSRIAMGDRPESRSRYYRVPGRAVHRGPID
jgi:hypothetical protein